MTPEFQLYLSSQSNLLLNKRLFSLLEEGCRREKETRGERLLPSISRRKGPLLAGKRLLKKYRNVSLIEPEWSWIVQKLSANVDDDWSFFW